MNNHSIDAYFEALRQEEFLFSKDDAASAISKVPLKPLWSKSAALKIFLACTLFGSLSVYFLWHKYDSTVKPHSARNPSKIISAILEPKIGTTINTNPDKGALPVQNYVTIASGHEQPHIEGATPLFPFLVSAQNNNGPASAALAPGYGDGTNNYQAPNINGWPETKTDNPCYDPKNISADRKLMTPAGSERIDSLKLIILKPEEYAALGIRKTRTGVFLELGTGFVTCYNRHAMYSKPDFTGDLKAPMPTVVTDEHGGKIRSSALFSPLAKTDKNTALGAMKPIPSYDMLIPILVKNDLDTSHGSLGSSIIVWYDPTNPMFESLVPEALKDKMLAGYTASVQDKEPQIPADAAHTTTVENTAAPTQVNAPNCWSGFKVYPNPVCTDFNLGFSLADSKALKIILFDISGKQIKVLQPETIQPKGDLSFDFDISELRSGMYILAVESNMGELWTQRLIKQ